MARKRTPEHPQSITVSVYRTSLVREGTLTFTHLPIGETVDTPRRCADVFAAYMHDFDTEHFCILFLSSQLQITGIRTIAVGGMSGAVITPRDVFVGLPEYAVYQIVLGHNHPSGQTAPSREDKACTRRIRKAGDVLGIPVRDHIIIGYPLAGGYNYFSFVEGGLLT